MIWNVETSTTPVARKDYICEACQHLIKAGIGMDDVTPEEWREIRLAEMEGWVIKKGERYECTRGIWDGRAGTYRARPEIEAIVMKYQLADC